MRRLALAPKWSRVVYAQLAAFVIWIIRRRRDVVPVIATASGEGTAGTDVNVISTATSQVTTHPHRSVEERVAFLEVVVQNIRTEVADHAARLMAAESKWQATAEAISAENAKLRKELAAARARAIRLDTLGLFPIAVGIVLSGIPDDLARAWGWIGALSATAGVAALVVSAARMAHDNLETWGRRAGSEVA